MPCVADPGNIIVAMAHKHEIKVTPLPGSSSLFMALAASGLNGQNFTFHGYIPIEKNARKKFLCQIELTAIKTKQSQIFIETPYRNQSLLDTILSICKPSTLLCIAINIGSMSEFIKTKSINEWKKLNIRISKEPAVFILGT